jgi:hypothetical protein
MMTRPAPSHALTLALGLAAGWGLAVPRLPGLRAQGGADHSGEMIVASGPIATVYQAKQRVQVTHDALYYLDYKGGRLLATVPTLRQTVAGTRVLEEFAERDLVADFRIGPGVVPHFLMTVGGLGASGDGGAPLFVVETATNQVAAYRVQPQTVGRSSRPRFDLLEIRSLARATAPAPRRATGAGGPPAGPRPVRHGAGAAAGSAPSAGAPPAVIDSVNSSSLPAP